MAMQDQPIPVAWTSVLPGLRFTIASWPHALRQTLAPLRAPVQRLLASDRFALGLGGMLWAFLLILVVHTPA